MARARNIKPGLFANEILGVADPLLTILFASLWCLADKAGRLEDRPERIKAATFPYRENVKIEELLCNLQGKGFVTRYKVNELRLIQVNEFSKHQKPHHTEKESVLPPCDAKALIYKPPSEITVRTPYSNGKNTVVKRSDSLIPDLLIPDSLIPDSPIYEPPNSQKDQDFENFWRMYPKRPGANKTKSFDKWKARIKERTDPRAMQYGAKRYRDYCEALQTEGRYILQAYTFLGPDKHYLLDWAAPSKAEEFNNWLFGKPKDEGDGIIDI
jgi:hypothetical protein